MNVNKCQFMFQLQPLHIFIYIYICFITETFLYLYTFFISTRVGRGTFLHIMTLFYLVSNKYKK